MNKVPHSRLRPRWLFLASCFGLVGLAAGHSLLFAPAYGAQLGYRTLRLSNNEISATTTDYLLSFYLSTVGPLGSISIQFCSNDPLIGDPCVAPVGFDDSNAVLADQVGPGGFSISNLSTSNKIILTRPLAITPISFASYHFTGITNPSVPGSYYARVQTFSTTNTTGQASDYGGIAFAILNDIAISAEVPPYLIFCTGLTIANLNCANASGDYIDFGELSTSRTSSGSSQMLVATNAQSGYNVTAYGTTLTSGNNVITALTNNDVARPGVAQFGFNLRANTTPPDGDDPSGPGTGAPTAFYDQPNSYRFDSGDTIISNTAPDNLREYTASYIVNVPATQAPGIYVSTLTYIALATF